MHVAAEAYYNETSFFAWSAGCDSEWVYNMQGSWVKPSPWPLSTAMIILGIVTLWYVCVRYC